MVSIATGQNSFYLPYLSIDNVQNNHHHIQKYFSSDWLLGNAKE